MANAYDQCPCGSGKKLKWCCAPYFDRIEHAFSLQQNNQNMLAEKEFERLLMDHPNRPQVHGFYANLLVSEGKLAEAEAQIDAALKLDPQFGMGYLLRGVLRLQEGEILGSLLLFRKAAEAFPLEATEQQTNVHELIARHEVQLNRPVAARAALERACKFSPTDQELREHFNAVYGSESRLPAAAVKPYQYRPTAKPLDVSGLNGKLQPAKEAFRALTVEVAEDPAAWFNLGLTQAWLGEQGPAIESLKKSLELEWNDTHAEETAALLEVLSCAIGQEAESDYVETRIVMQVRDVQAVFGLLQQMAQSKQILAPQMDEQNGVFTCLVVEELPNLLDTGTTIAKSAANLSIAGGFLRLWNTDGEMVRKVANQFRDRLALAIGEPSESSGTAQYSDLIQPAMAFPIRMTDIPTTEAKLRDYAAQYFELAWVNRPLKSLSGATPNDAAGSKLLRKRLLGVVRFLQDCYISASPRRRTENGKSAPIELYDFNQLRHKIGAVLQPSGPAPTITVPAAATPTPAPVAPPPRDFQQMNAADLASVDLTQCSVADCEAAMRAALKLDARELAARFAKVGAQLPADSAKPDRYPLFACIVTATLAEGDNAEALALAERGAADDLAHNEGKRANDYGLLKGKLYARAGRILEATAEYDSLLDRSDDEPRFIIAATEAMLSAKQPQPALRYAERGLAKARKSGNRDLEGACLELSEAANRQMAS